MQSKHSKKLHFFFVEGKCVIDCIIIKYFSAAETLKMNMLMPI